MAYPPVIIVDDNDQELGLAPLQEAWEKGLNYRTVQVMVEDGQGRLLLQRRSNAMELFPGRWEVSAAGHVDEGLTYQTAAQSEVAEELGIEHAELEELGKYFIKRRYPGRIMRYFGMVYKLRGAPDDLRPSPEEVSELKWLPIDEAKQFAAAHPEQTTDVLREILARYY